MTRAQNTVMRQSNTCRAHFFVALDFTVLLCLVVSSNRFDNMLVHLHLAERLGQHERGTLISLVIFDLFFILWGCIHIVHWDVA